MQAEYAPTRLCLDCGGSGLKAQTTYRNITGQQYIFWCPTKPSSVINCMGMAFSRLLPSSGITHFLTDSNSFFGLLNVGVKQCSATPNFVCSCFRSMPFKNCSKNGASVQISFNFCSMPFKGSMDVRASTLRTYVHSTFERTSIELLLVRP